MSGVALFQRAEGLYAQGKIQETFETYQKCIRKILRDENPTANIPAILPDDFPRETLGAVWRNFVGFFRDPAMSFTAETAPEAYKLLNSFRPTTTSKLYARLERTDRGKVLLKGMQITAGLTLGLMAWDNRDRATASKRYKEALDLAATHPPFSVLAPGAVGLERWVYMDLQETKENLGRLVQNDTVHAAMVGGAPQRRDVVDLPIGHIRIDKTGEATTESATMFATNECGKCGKRDVKLMRCGQCKKMPCESCFLSVNYLLTYIMFPRLRP